MSTEREVIFDDDNPEWTEEDFANAMGPESMTAVELAAFPLTRLRLEGKIPKQQVTLRLSPEVLAGFRATGKGWQTRIDQALKAHLGL